MAGLIDPHADRLTDEQVNAISGRLDIVGLTWEKVTIEVQDDSSTPPYLTTTMRQRPVEAIVRDVLAAASGSDHQGKHVPRCNERCHDGWHYLAEADAVQRVLTGEAGDE